MIDSTKPIPASASPPRRVSKAGLWLFRLVAIGVSILACELFLSVAASVSPRVRYYLEPPWNRAVIPDQVLGRRMSPYYPGHDSRGYRNDRVPDRCDILAIGDSLTYGFAAASQDSWPRQLETLCGKTVYNGGVGGYGPCEYEVVLEELTDLKPDTVVIGLYLGNDFADAYRVVYLEDRFPQLRTQDEKVLEEMRSADRQATLPELQAKFGVVREDVQPAQAKGLLQGSSLYALARGLYYDLGAGQVPMLHEGGARSFEEAAQRPYRLPYDKDPRFRTVFRPPGLEGLAVNQTDPRIREGRRITEQVLLSIKDKLDRQSIRLLVVLLPNKPTLYAEAVDPQQLGEMAEDFHRLVASEATLRRELSDFLELHQIAFIDAQSDLRRCFEQGVRPYLESDDHHPNAAGYQAIAEGVCRALGEPVRGDKER